MKHYSTQEKVVGAVRILLGLGMLIFGNMKFGADAEMQAFVGGAGHSILPFLSVGAWFWIATIGEIVAGLRLLSGVKGGAMLTILIMLFALNATGFADPKAWIFLIAAIAVIVFKGGAWKYGAKGCGCKKGSCKCSMQQQQ